MAQTDQEAFAEVVRRHGPMVLRVCRRSLQHAEDAEDAFQATFIVLARKAAAVTRKESVGGWLHCIAWRIAWKARHRKAGESLRGSGPFDGAATERAVAEASGSEMASAELRAVLDEEVSRLPEKYRLPLVLCHLEGKTVEQAAQQLGSNAGTIKWRLHEARELLRGRLLRRGVTASSAGLAAVLAQEAASAALPAVLCHAVMQAVEPTSGVAAVSPQVMGLVKAMLHSDTSRRCFLGLLGTVGGLGIAAAVFGWRRLAARARLAGRRLRQSGTPCWLPCMDTRIT